MISKEIEFIIIFVLGIIATRAYYAQIKGKRTDWMRSSEWSDNKYYQSVHKVICELCPRRWYCETYQNKPQNWSGLIKMQMQQSCPHTDLTLITFTEHPFQGLAEVKYKLCKTCHKKVYLNEETEEPLKPGEATYIKAGTLS